MMTPSSVSQGRLAGFHIWYESTASGRRLRVAALCLQLTTIAVNISSQKAEAKRDRLPTLLRLAKGEVQTRTLEHLEKLLDNLGLDPELDVLAAVEGLLVTEIHILIRYKQYGEYPYQLWRLSIRWNGIGASPASEELLSKADTDLDAGCSLLLKQEALSQGSYSDALLFLLSDGIQKIIDGIVEHTSATSLDVEREHQHVKRPEKGKVLSVAAASRNNIIRKYLVLRLLSLACHMKQTKKDAKLKNINWFALALKRRPDLFKRPRGALHWETGISAADMQALSFAGDAAGADEFVAEHKDELVEEAARQRASVVAPTDAALNESFPILNREWLGWHDKHHDMFRGLLKDAPISRSLFNQRVYVDDEALPAAPRLYAKPHRAPPADWEQKLQQSRQGWFALTFNGRPRIPFFCGTLRSESMAVVLHEAGDNVFELRCDDVSELFQPLATAVGDMLRRSAGPVSLVQLVMSIVQVLPPRTFRLEVLDYRHVQLKPRASKSAADDADGVSDASDADALRGADSDASSVVSAREPDAEHEVEESQKDPLRPLDSEGLEDVALEAAEGPAGKMAAGTYVMSDESDGYFTLINDPNHPNIKILVKPRWAKPPPEGMGVVARQQSQTVYPRDFGEDKACPRISLLVACSWKLWRSKHHGFVNSSPARQSWYNDELDSLSRRLQALGVAGGGTGNTKANAMIRSWTPDAFAI